MQNNDDMAVAAAIAAVLAAIVGVGKLLQSNARITWRIVVGRVFVHIGLGLSAFAVLAWIPDVEPIAVMGLAMVVASVGESLLERIINKYIGDDHD